MAANMVVRTNVFSLNAHRNMKNVGLEQRRSSNRLASGYRINSAADDAAGLAISENMRAQIRGLDQASRNAQDGQAMILTTEGGLTEIGNILIRTRELMVQAANDTNTSDQRQMIEQEVQQLGREIHSMQARVEFNTNRVLDMGPVVSPDAITNLAKMETSNAALQAYASHISDMQLATQRALDLISEMSTISVTANLAGAQKAAVEAALEGVLNFSITKAAEGLHVAGFATAATPLFSAPDPLNDVGGSTGQLDDTTWVDLTTGVWEDHIILIEGWNRNTVLTNWHTEATTPFASEDVHIGLNAIETTDTVVDNIGRLQTVLGVRMQMLSDIQTEILNRAGEVRATISTNYTIARAHASAASGGQAVAFFQVGANASQGVYYDFERVARSVTAAGWVVRSIGEGMSSPSVGSGIGAGVDISPFIDMVDSSITDINQVRANLGALQNRLDFTMRSLDISSENLSDAESRVRNADIAREMMRFTMTNVLQQAAVSMLSQANQIPQNLLQLLR